MRTNKIALSIVYAMVCMIAANAKATAVDDLSGKDSPLRPGERIAFVGDSITWQGGYITMLKAAIDKGRPDIGVTMIRAGINGAKVPDIQKTFDDQVLARKPSVIVIYIGINDVWHSLQGHGTPKDQFESGLRDMITRGQKAGAIVILATPSVIGEARDGKNQLDKQLNEYADISRKVAADMHIQLADVHAAFVAAHNIDNTEDKHDGVLTYDGVHMLPAGNQILEETMAGAIEKALAGAPKDRISTPAPLGTWTSEQVALTEKQLDFDAAAAASVTDAGTYEVSFDYTSGGSRLDIEKVVLLEDGKPVASDEHNGFTGDSCERNAYLLKLDNRKAGAKYTFEATVKTNGGTKSNGNVTLSELK